ncbi:MAG TPA: hypothetical protein DC058_24500 [Planctomycetaceae bacterium]|nr:hypothetical protein [Planctomycetaceae bacterium]HBC64362.1 hypothetical protein [Planctomycetaceae bacterium]
MRRCSESFSQHRPILRFSVFCCPVNVPEIACQIDSAQRKCRNVSVAGGAAYGFRLSLCRKALK